MKAPLSLELASSLLFRKKHRKFRDSPLFAAFVGITLSIIPLIMVIQVSDGMIKGILNRYIETFYSHIMIRLTQTHSNQLDEDLTKIPDVTINYREYKGGALLLNRKKRTAVQVRSLQNEAFTEDQGLLRYLQIKEGQMDLDPGSIILSSNIALKMGLSIGDSVTLLTGAKLHQQSSWTPKVKKLTVKAIISTGYQELDRLWVFISFADAKRFFHPSNSQLLMHIKTTDPFHSKKIRQLTHKINRLLSPNEVAKPWYHLASELQQSYRFSKSMLVYIMYLIVAVGVINIASSMLLQVLENRSDIAIMKTFGAPKTFIRNIYIWIALLVSGTATGIGLVLGTGFSYYINEIIYGIDFIVQIITIIHNWISNQSLNSQVSILDKSFYLEAIPILQFQALPLLMVGIFVLLITLFCSIIPAIKAASVQTIKILRHDYYH